jgi:hypothetical protein
MNWRIKLVHWLSYTTMHDQRNIKIIFPYWKVKLDRLSRNVGNKLPLPGCITSQKSADLIYFAAEAWNCARYVGTKCALVEDSRTVGSQLHYQALTEVCREHDSSERAKTFHLQGMCESKRHNDRQFNIYCYIFAILLSWHRGPRWYSG